MKTYTTAELNEILRNHKHWLMEDMDGWEKMRADLYEANLRGADLRGAYLYGANLCGANLRGAYNIPFVPMTCPDAGTFVAWKRQTDALSSWRFQRMLGEVPQRGESVDAIKRK